MSKKQNTDEIDRNARNAKIKAEKECSIQLDFLNNLISANLITPEIMDKIFKIVESFPKQVRIEYNDYLYVFINFKNKNTVITKSIATGSIRYIDYAEIKIVNENDKLYLEKLREALN